MFNCFDSDQVLIERPAVRGANMLMLRKADEELPTQTLESQPPEPTPPLPIIDCRMPPDDRRVSILRLPIITRVRAALSEWIAPR